MFSVNRSEQLRWVQAVAPPVSGLDDERIYEEWGKHVAQQ